MFCRRSGLRSLPVLLLAMAWLDAAGSPPAAWRPFSADSPWNRPIAAGTEADPDSRALIDDLASRGAFHINITDWSIPVYFVDADRTPLRDVGDSRPDVYGRGFEFPRRVPIPDGAVASPPVGEFSDNHLCIIDRAKQLEWGMWAARQDPTGRWFTGLGAVTDLAGTGVAPPWFASRRQLDSHRARASGFPLVAGLILRDEVASGRIDHALVFAYDHCRSGFLVPPASTSQSAKQEAIDARGIPMGGRIQLDPSWDVEHSALSRAGKAIARALQEYGAYCGDYADGNVLYAENSPAAVQAWKGVLAGDTLAATFTPEFIRAHFRVVVMGNLLPGQNLSVPPPYVISFSVAGETAPARIDQLNRTVVVALSPSAPGALPASWELFPSDSQVECNGQPVGFGAQLDLAKPATITLTAPDGRTASWTIIRESR
ncbi:MAG TPA: hypothetical protein VG936_07500 [Lacunisphaera sp.]|nr:hypothetical protein [Lacunisphaera sp.]